MSLSSDLYQSFIRYQGMIKREFEYMSRRHGFVEMDAQGRIQDINAELRKRIAKLLKIKATRYKPSSALAHLWR